MSVCLSIYLIYLSVYISSNLTACLFVYLPIYVYIYLSVCLPARLKGRQGSLSVCLSIYLFIYHSIYLSLYIFYWRQQQQDSNPSTYQLRQCRWLLLYILRLRTLLAPGFLSFGRKSGHNKERQRTHFEVPRHPTQRHLA
jgi:hypothetical protein